MSILLVWNSLNLLKTATRSALRMEKTFTLPILKFKKDKSFSILKGLGYKFQRMYANNYMSWYKTPDKEGYGDAITVWKKNNNIELSDLYSLSGLVALYLRDLDYEKESEFLDLKNCTGGFDKSDSWLNVVVNMKTCEIEEYDFEKHDSGMISSELRYVGMPKEEIKVKMREFHNTYYVKVLNEEYVNMVKNMWNDGFVEIVSQERTREI